MQLYYRIVLKCIYLSLMLMCSGCSKEPQNINAPVSSTAKADQHNKEISTPMQGLGVVDQSSVLVTTNNLLSQDPNANTHTPLETIIFSELGRGVAYIESLDGRQRVVHNGKPGNFYTEINHLAVSPDGKRVSYSCVLGDKTVLMISDGVVSQAYNDVYRARYSPDSRHVAYLAQTPDTKAHIILDGKSIEESPSAVGGALVFTDDSSKLLYHVRPVVEGHQSKLVIYDLKSGKKSIKECLDNPTVLSRNKDRIAMAVMDGNKQRVINFKLSAPEDVIKSGLYDEIINFSIGIEDTSVTFVGKKAGHLYLVLNNKEERLPDPSIRAVYNFPVIRPDQKGVGYILATNELHSQSFSFQQAMYRGNTGKKQYDQIRDLVYNRVNSIPAFVALRGEKCFVVINGKEGTEFDNVVTPKFSPDGSKLVYRARQGDKRFVVVADIATNVHRRHTEYEIAYPTVFTSDGKSVAYGVKNGNQLSWKVEKL